MVQEQGNKKVLRSFASSFKDPGLCVWMSCKAACAQRMGPVRLKATLLGMAKPLCDIVFLYIVFLKTVLLGLDLKVLWEF